MTATATSTSFAPRLPTWAALLTLAGVFLTMKRLFPLLLLAAAPLAAQTTYPTPWAFQAAATSAYSLEGQGFDALFRDQVLPTGTTLPGGRSTVTFTAFPLGTEGRVDQTYGRWGVNGLGLWDPVDPSLDYFMDDEGLTLTFSQPVYALGVRFNLAGSPAGAYGIQAGGATAGNPAGCTYPLCFVGLWAPTPFTTAYVGGLTGTGGYGFTLDDLQWVIDAPAAPGPVGGTDPTGGPLTSTPEPVTLGLVGLGLVALGTVRKKRTP